MADFTIKQHDTRPIMELVLKSNGQPLDLTTATGVTLLMKEIGGATTVSRAAAIYDAANGVVRVTFQSPDTDVVGSYNAECEITWGVGQIETVPNVGYIQIDIVADLG